MLTSIVIRTLNEARFLGEALTAIENQTVKSESIEIVIVDSGSTDDTLDIARSHHCKIVQMKKEDFTFGRALNVGCAAASGEYLVFLSGHCIPTTGEWLANLIAPLESGEAVYTYGRQEGSQLSAYSEIQHFNKYFPASAEVRPMKGFSNNANAALTRSVWKRYPFDEALTGLEDMALAKELLANSYRVTYQADASVYHIHTETFAQTTHRYQREAYALCDISPLIQFNLLDVVQYTVKGIWSDLYHASDEGCLDANWKSIFAYRFAQYWGTFKGNQQSRIDALRAKRAYFDPLDGKI